MFGKKPPKIEYRKVEILVPEDKFQNFYKTKDGEMFLDLSKDWQEGDFYKGVVKTRYYRGSLDFCSEDFKFRKEKLRFKIVNFYPDKNK